MRVTEKTEEKGRGREGEMAGKDGGRAVLLVAMVSYGHCGLTGLGVAIVCLGGHESKG